MTPHRTESICLVYKCILKQDHNKNIKSCLAKPSSVISNLCSDTDWMGSINVGLQGPTQWASVYIIHRWLFTKICPCPISSGGTLHVVRNSVGEHEYLPIYRKFNSVFHCKLVNISHTNGGATNTIPKVRGSMPTIRAHWSLFVYL